jgi:hypothetical protein
VAARGWLNLATRSGRGGTTGRAAGCPARGLAGGRAAPGIGGATTAAGGGVRITGPGLMIGADGRMLSPLPGGSGCRGPDRTWPGLNCGSGLGGGGTGRPGATAAGGGAVTTGWDGAACTVGGGGGPGGAELGPASGGRIGCEGRPAGVPGINFSGDGSGAFSSRATAVRGATGARSGADWVCTISDSCSWYSSESATGSAWSSPSEISWPRNLRNFKATSSSIELEWVFFSVTPSSGSLSRISCAFTSSSRASSLIRIFFIITRLDIATSLH